MESQEVKKLRAETIADYYKQVSEASDAMNKLSIDASNDHVVISAGRLALTYDYEDGQHFNPRVCGVMSAPRFPKEMAEHLAAITFDGSGTPATAVPFVDAVKENCAELLRLARVLEEIQAKS